MSRFQHHDPAEEELIAISQQWADAEVNRDAAVLDRLLDDEFILVTGNQETMVGKAAFIELARGFTFTSMNQDYEHIRIDGDTAIVVTTVRVRLATGGDGGFYRCTVTYVKREGAWRALAEQIGPVTP